MKALTNYTLVLALAMSLWATASMAGEVSNLPVSSSEKDITTATASSAPLFALSGLDAGSLAAQGMTDQELKAIEGGMTLVEAFLNGFESGKSTRLWGSNGNVIMGSCVSCQGM